MAIDNVQPVEEPAGFEDNSTAGAGGFNADGTEGVDPDEDDEDEDGPVAGEDEQDEDDTGRSGAVFGEEDGDVEEQGPAATDVRE